MAEINYDFDVHKLGSFMYNWVSGYMDATFRAVKRVGYDLSGKTLYDIGIGRGRGLALFKALSVRKVVGIDVNASEGHYAKAGQERLGIDLELITDDVRNSYLRGLPNDSCEIVSVMNILFILPPDVRAVILKEAKRILHPGGILIIMDGCRPSLMWFFNTLSRMGRIFSTEGELKKLLFPLKLIATEPSNYLYFFNKPLDLLGKVFGPEVYKRMDRLLRFLHISPSTKTFVFKKM